MNDARSFAIAKSIVSATPPPKMGVTVSIAFGRRAASIAALAVISVQATIPIAVAQRKEAARQAELVIQTGHTGEVRAVALSPDGRSLLTGSADDTAILWDTQSGQTLHSLEGHADEVIAVACSPDRKRTLTASYDGTAIVRDARTGDVVKVFKCQGAVRCCAFSPDGKELVTAADQTTLWDVETGQRLRTLGDRNDRAVAVAYSRDGSEIVTASSDSTSIVCWETKTGRKIRTVGKTDKVDADPRAAFSPDGTRAANSTSDEPTTVRLWDVHSGAELRSLHLEDGAWVNSLAISSDCRFILTGTENSTVVLWNAETGNAIRTFDLHDIKDDTRILGKVCSVAFTSDNHAVVGTDVAIAILWDPWAKGHAKVFGKPYESCDKSLVLSPDCKRLVTVSDIDNKGVLWDLETGHKIGGLDENAIGAVVFSPNSKQLAGTSKSKTVMVWDARDGKTTTRSKDTRKPFMMSDTAQMELYC